MWGSVTSAYADRAVGYPQNMATSSPGRHRGTSAMLKGVGEVFNPAGTKSRYSSRQRSVNAALRSDWQKIGRDFDVAIAGVKGSVGRRSK